ncbi:MAG: hypothetical protein M0R33_09845 [Methylomonas sp.]|jgi:hypothetical protein|uniref:hypothetical protein n=1 Tax=Methylomonas sp. TaxID=418 RepID=UPI0025D6ACFA|nr:hypothetical protein [Methylomonas sp.]MCK9606733.1 hypothetical protein [Methylomonas sp.]
MSALSKMRQAGFIVSLNDTDIEIRPASKLSEQQRHHIKTHRDTIVSELLLEQRRQRFSHWRIVCRGQIKELVFCPPHTFDEIKHVYKNADLIEPITHLAG